MVAAAVGMYDGVHLGHQALVRQLNEEGRRRGLHSVVFTFAQHPLEVVSPERAPALLTTPRQKEHLLRLAGADKVVTLNFNEALRGLTAEEFMRRLREKYSARLLLMGFNHRFGHDQLSNLADYQAIGRRLGIEVAQGDEELAEDGRHVSSSAIRRAIGAGNIAEANSMLGRPYSIVGTVAHGQGIGRTIGFPTANVAPHQSRQLVPGRGVYAGTIAVAGGAYPAMINIGSRPTIADGLEPTIEAHAIGYEGDLYGREAAVNFISRIRDEQKFASLEQLSEQLEKDKQSVLAELAARQS